MPSLYKLSEDYKFLSESLEASMENDELGEDDFEMYKNTLEALEDGIESKCENIVKFMRNLEGDIAAYKAEEQRLNKKRKYMENKHEWLKKYIHGFLELNNIESANAGTFKIKLQKSPPSVGIIDPSKISDIYKIAQEAKIDNKGILAELKSGGVVEGAELIKDKKYVKIT